MRLIALLSAALVAFSVACCQPSTPTPPVPDAAMDSVPPPPALDASPSPPALDASPTPPGPAPAPVADASASDASGPPSAPGDGGAPPSACTKACANVKAKIPQCPEGQYADCAATCAVIAGDSHQVQPNLAKLAAAKTVADVRASGWSCRLDGG